MNNELINKKIKELLEERKARGFSDTELEKIEKDIREKLKKIEDGTEDCLENVDNRIFVYHINNKFVAINYKESNDVDINKFPKLKEELDKKEIEYNNLNASMDVVVTYKGKETKLGKLIYLANKKTVLITKDKDTYYSKYKLEGRLRTDVNEQIIEQIYLFNKEVF